MSDKEIQLLKFCVAMVLFFSLSYMPLAIVLAVFELLFERIPSFVMNVIIANALCGSLWNPLLYFFYEFLSKETLFGTS